jgi:predicted MFS family arabinose efflux permease
VTLVTFILAVAVVREEPQPRVKGAWRPVARELARAAKTPAVRAAAAFLFLWNFNPFSNSVIYVHMTRDLQMGEQFYGITISFLSVGAILGSLLYGLYCRRVPLRWLIHGAIVMGILSTLAYWGLRGTTSALAISVLVGFTYMTGSLVQFDLAARVCPVAAAGTVFAVLLSISNLSLSSSEWLGGNLFDQWTALWGSARAFQALVGIGALSTCACWLVAPFLGREVKQ